MLSELPSPTVKAIPPRKVLTNSAGVFVDRIKQRFYKVASAIIAQHPKLFEKLKSVSFRIMFSFYFLLFNIIQWTITLVILSVILSVAFLAANTVVFGSPLKFDADADLQVTKSLMTCRNTVQGKVLVTDDKGNGLIVRCQFTFVLGYVCKHENLDRRTGCCKEHKKRPFSCPREYCNTTSYCCSVYEHCVACCMDPQKAKVRTVLLETTSDPIILGNKDDVFELCRYL